MGKMDGKVALITGGARGQGRAHAVAFAEAGADVIITDICEDIRGVKYPLATEDDMAETMRLVEATGRRCLSYKADARDGARMQEAVNQAVAELGHLDSVVINHGIGLPHGSGSDSLDDWDTVIDTNLNAVWRTVVAVLPHLKGRSGSITITGSAASTVGIFGNAGYTTAKHGLVGLVKCLAADLAQEWTRVNLILPTNVNTKLFVNDYNLGRFCPEKENPTIEDMKSKAQSLNLLPLPWVEPEDISPTVLFLASDDAKYITGIAMPIDAGMTIQPPGITPHIGQMLGELQYQIDNPR